LRKIIALSPDVPERRYDLVRVEAATGRGNAALADLRTVLDLNAKRLATNPAAHNLITDIRTDPSLNSLRSLPEFRQLVPAQ